MPFFDVSIEAAETIYYSADFEIEAETAEEAKQKARQEFLYNASPYEVGSEGLAIQTTFCEEV